jgi:hypothetical protein
MRKFCRQFAISVAFVACGLSAPIAAETCTPWKDAAKQLALGQFVLGHPRQTFPLSLPHSNCGTAPSPDEEVCEYFDGNGFAYLVDQTGVIRVEARRARAKKGMSLPLGLMFGDSEAVVRKKLTALPAESPAASLVKQPKLGATQQSRSWATGHCVETEHGVAGSFYLIFDRNKRLTTVGMRLNV